MMNRKELENEIAGEGEYATWFEAQCDPEMPFWTTIHDAVVTT